MPLHSRSLGGVSGRCAACRRKLNRREAIYRPKTGYVCGSCARQRQDTVRPAKQHHQAGGDKSA